MRFKFISYVLIILSIQLIHYTRASANVEFIHDNNLLVEHAKFKKRTIFLLVGAAVTLLGVKAVSGVSKVIDQKNTYKKIKKSIEKDQKRVDENAAKFIKKNNISLVFDEENQETRLVRNGEMLEPSSSCGKDLEPSEAYWRNLSKNKDIFGFINEKGGITIVKNKGEKK